MNNEDFDPEKFGRSIAAEAMHAELTPHQQARLAAARQRALARSRAPARALAGLAGWSVRHPTGARRLMQLAWLALLVSVMFLFWPREPDTYIDDEIDAKLLADEVPLDAWLSDKVDYLARSES